MARAGVAVDFAASYRGRDGVRAFVETYQDAFSSLSYEPEWLVDLGDNMLVILVHHTVRGRASGLEVEQITAQRLQLSKGLVVREDVHAAPVPDRDEVVRAVGLDPPELSREGAGRSSRCGPW